MASKRKGITSDVHRIAAARRRAAVLELRKGGATFEQIGQQLGYANRSGAYQAFQQAIRDIPKEAADEMRAVEQERLNAMHLAVWNRALRGDVQAIGTVLGIMQARARLFGLFIETQSTPPLVVQKGFLGIPIEEL